MSSRFKTQWPLSDDLITKIIDWPYYVRVNIALFYLRQLFSANFHLKPAKDYINLWNDLRQQISLIQGAEYKPGHDKTVFKKAPLDTELGNLYRDKILLGGGSQDDMDLLKDLLGREPNPKAFIEKIEDDRKRRAGVKL